MGVSIFLPHLERQTPLWSLGLLPTCRPWHVCVPAAWVGQGLARAMEFPVCTAQG